jgi:hypothetical protein
MYGDMQNELATMTAAPKPLWHNSNNKKIQMELNKRSISLQSLVIGIAAVGVLAISLVTYSQWLTTRVFDQNITFMRLAQSVQQEIATAHLWFEEALGGDTYIDLNDDVRGRIQSARELVDAAMIGGVTPVGEVTALPGAHDNLVAPAASAVPWTSSSMPSSARFSTCHAPLVGKSTP